MLGLYLTNRVSGIFSSRFINKEKHDRKKLYFYFVEENGIEKKSISFAFFVIIWILNLDALDQRCPYTYLSFATYGERHFFVRYYFRGNILMWLDWFIRHNCGKIKLDSTVLDIWVRRWKVTKYVRLEQLTLMKKLRSWDQI